MLNSITLMPRRLQRVSLLIMIKVPVAGLRRPDHRRWLLACVCRHQRERCRQRHCWMMTMTTAAEFVATGCDSPDASLTAAS